MGKKCLRVLFSALLFDVNQTDWLLKEDINVVQYFGWPFDKVCYNMDDNICH